MSAAALAERIRGIELVPEPWPHATLDDFLPADVFACLLESIGGLQWDQPPAGHRRKATQLPVSVVALLSDPAILQAIRERFGFTGGKPMIEVAWFGGAGLAPHVDRKDKVWNGQVYLSGEPKGTELYDAQDRLVKVVEWAPNRLTCWLPPGNLKHAAPQSKGRYVLLWWLLNRK